MTDKQLEAHMAWFLAVVVAGCTALMLYVALM